MSLWQLLNRIGRPIDGETFVMNGGLVVRVSPLRPRWTLSAVQWGDKSRRTRLYPASWSGEPAAGFEGRHDRTDAAGAAFGPAPEGTWQST